MLRAGDIFENPRTGAVIEMVQVPRDGDGRLDVRRVMKPGTGKAAAHVHMDYVERFLIESGRATAKIEGRTVTAGPGEQIEVRVGQAHTNPFNAGPEDLVMHHVFEPASDFVLAYVETLGHLMLEGRADRQGELPLLAAFAIAHATDAQSFAAGVPHGLQKSVIAPAGAWVAKLRGIPIRVA
jgi:mannose-6-phosphate isomerase-like protein (cupin superfamily)